MPRKKPEPKRKSALKGASSTKNARNAKGEPMPALVPRMAIPLEALVPPERLEPPGDFTPADATDPSPLPPIAVKIEAAAKGLYRAATTALPDPPADNADESEQRAFLQAVEDWKSDLCFTAGWGGADLDRHIPAEWLGKVLHLRGLHAASSLLSRRHSPETPPTNAGGQTDCHKRQF